MVQPLLTIHVSIRKHECASAMPASSTSSSNTAFLAAARSPQLMFHMTAYQQHFQHIVPNDTCGITLPCPFPTFGAPANIQQASRSAAAAADARILQATLWQRKH
jgi:hypothetical protein